MFLHLPISHSVHRGCTPPRQTPPPPRDGHWSGQYASYWNSFLFWKVLQDLSEQSFLAIKSDLGLVTWMFDINFEFMNVGWNLNMTLQVPLLEWKKMLIFIFVKKLLLYFYVCPQNIISTPFYCTWSIVLLYLQYIVIRNIINCIQELWFVKVAKMHRLQLCFPTIKFKCKIWVV